MTDSNFSFAKFTGVGWALAYLWEEYQEFLRLRQQIVHLLGDCWKSLILNPRNGWEEEMINTTKLFKFLYFLSTTNVFFFVVVSDSCCSTLLWNIFVTGKLIKKFSRVNRKQQYQYLAATSMKRQRRRNNEALYSTMRCRGDKWTIFPSPESITVTLFMIFNYECFKVRKLQGFSSSSSDFIPCFSQCLFSLINQFAELLVSTRSRTRTSNFIAELCRNNGEVLCIGGDSTFKRDLRRRNCINKQCSSIGINLWTLITKAPCIPFNRDFMIREVV